ncbi:exopolysaccharide biosynthesis polyprenyl glycosylphosphotransferase [Sphingomicrobium astaxanthinifaciens]|uniref:exopolysaccharide biosynthesis polyprenyl glycosylphosphotransferase n=1 Tax=Sphingomicrobium astaxanthinifaciens TaxID=1227949 RepID=UPI001FCA682C|nr:exopolysaccharide biosynthesis polyprenyl glycosylphosphotransferase [Sphingomicrobium astaxanthinifaciens]MCJ7420417.1 exopolysaccharide biosynthesis polyprenyl glycosylphosphotransferase [Sphingomicrobium astaxanthinifaciens]
MSLANWDTSPAIINSLIGAAASALISILVLRRLRLFPGAPLARSILPVVGGVYAGFVSLLLIARLEYSSYILVLAFVGTLLARFAIETLHVRVEQLVFYVVPGGRAALVHELERTPTAPLLEPCDDGVPGHAIVADLHAEIGPEWERFLAEAAISGTPVYHYKQIWEAETGKVEIEHLSENSFGALVPSLVYGKIKRLVDVALCVVALPLVLPLLAICAIAVKLDSRGPVFFRQQRQGFRGKPFKVVKFRTMTEVNDGSDREAAVTLTDDERITRVGRFLRRYRIDELPQLFNVLWGEMSWIGPRPEAVGLSKWYEDELPFYRYRHIVRPGITGWAQVNQGHVASIDEVRHKLHYDFYYIKNLSYWLDIIIAFRTVRVVLFGYGAK